MHPSGQKVHFSIPGETRDGSGTALDLRVGPDAIRGPGTNPTNAQNMYRFGLTCTPAGAVGSPHANNAAVVATATPPNDSLGSCPVGFRNAAVVTYSSSEPDTSIDVAINFTIIFL
jgi:hypothetical protein